MALCLAHVEQRPRHRSWSIFKALQLQVTDEQPALMASEERCEQIFQVLGIFDMYHKGT